MAQLQAFLESLLGLSGRQWRVILSLLVCANLIVYGVLGWLLYRYVLNSPYGLLPEVEPSPAPTLRPTFTATWTATATRTVVARQPAASASTATTTGTPIPTDTPSSMPTTTPTAIAAIGPILFLEAPAAIAAAFGSQ